jgi:type IV pilus assembly protein PilM
VQITVPKLTLRRPGAARPVVGLDIEPGAIHAAQVAVNGHLLVERAVSAPLEPGIVRDGEVVDVGALAESLQRLFEEHDLDRRVRIGVANQRIVVRTLELPPIADASELAAAVRFLAADHVPMPLDQAVLDHVLLGTFDTPAGPRMRVLVVAARRDMIDKLLAAARAAGLRPEGIDLAAFALVRGIERSDDTVLHLAAGGLVNLALARGGQCVFTRVVSGGLEAMATELAERSDTTIEAARGRLMADGLDGGSDSRRVLTDGISRIAAEVRNSLDFHSGADIAEDRAERVALTGTAAGVPGFATALAEGLALPVDIAAPDAPGIESPHRYTVAAGLAVEEAPV